MSHRVVIVGGGFGGVTAAKRLRKANVDVHITLVSDRPWLEYYGDLYRLIRDATNIGSTCLPLAAMVDASTVDITIDRVTKIDVSYKRAIGPNGTYPYDTLILAPGGVPAYFDIPGMEEHSITMKSIREARELGRIVKRRIDEMAHAHAGDKETLGRFLIVGAGPTGIEIAGEILPLARSLASARGIDPALIDVRLIEAADRPLPMIEPTASAKVLKRLEALGVRVMTNSAVASADAKGVAMKDGKRLDAATLIWTAGVKAHPLLQTVEGLELDRRGRATVDEHLRAKGRPEIFVIGDCAVTPFSGMAQTAVEDGEFATKAIVAMLCKKPLPIYRPVPTAYAIPAGKRWAAVKYGPLRAYGWIGHLLRRAADLHVYMLMLPWRMIPSAFFGRVRLKRFDIDPAAVTGE